MADFRIRVIIDPSGARRGGRQVRKELTKVSNSADRTRRLIAQAFTLTAVTIGLRKLITVLAQFEQQMSTVRAITKATGVEFQLLTDEAKRLGATTRFSASQAADAMVFLARAGFETNEVLATIGDTLLLAQAGALGLGRAADIASNILKAFRLETSQVREVVDILAFAANNANTNVEQLGQAMKFVGPVARGLGVSLEVATAAAAALSDAGLQASMAGTGLRRILAELEVPSDKTAKILDGLEVSTDSVRVSQVGLIRALEILKNAGINTGQALEVFGKRGGPAFEVLVNSIPSVIRMTKALGDAGGTAERISVIMDANLNGALLAVRSAAEATILSFGDFISAVPPVEEVERAVNALDAQLEAGTISQENYNAALRDTLTEGQPLTRFFFAFAEGVRFVAANMDKLLEATLVLATLAIPKLIRGLKLLNVAIGRNAFGLLLITIVAVTAALTFFRDEIKVTEDGLVTLDDLMGAAFDALEPLALKDAITGELNPALGAIIKSITNLGEIKSFEQMAISFARGLDAMRALWNAFFQAITDRLNAIPIAIEVAFKLGVNRALNVNVFDVRKLQAELAESARPFGRAILEDAIKLLQEEGGQSLSEAMGKLFEDAREKARKGRKIPFIEITDRAKLSLLEEGGGGPKVIPGLKERQALLKRELDLLDEEARLLRVVGDEREVLSGILRIEAAIRDDLRERNEDLTEQQIIDLARLTEAERRSVEERTLRNLALEREAQLYEDIRGPQLDYEQGLAAINELLRKQRVNAAEAAEATRDLRIALLENQEDVLSGLERGFLIAQREIEDFASTTEDLVTGAFRNAQDALVEFVRTGKLSFRSLIDDMLTSIARLGTQQLFAGLFGGGPLGGGGGIGGFVSGLFGFQHGGQFVVGPQTALATAGGIDNRVIAFRARDREVVTITPPSGSRQPRRREGDQFNIKVEISGVSNVEEFRRSRDQIGRQIVQGIDRSRRRR